MLPTAGPEGLVRVRVWFVDNTINSLTYDVRVAVQRENTLAAADSPDSAGGAPRVTVALVDRLLPAALHRLRRRPSAGPSGPQRTHTEAHGPPSVTPTYSLTAAW